MSWWDREELADARDDARQEGADRRSEAEWDGEVVFAGLLGEGGVESGVIEPVRVSIFDPASGETVVQELPEDNYILLCGERCKVTDHQFDPGSGTHVLTIRTGLPADSLPVVDRRRRPPSPRRAVDD